MPTKKIILFVIDTVSVGGAELSVLEVAKNLKQFTPIVAVVYEAPNGLRESFEQAGIPLVFFEVRKRFGFAEAIKKLKVLIQKERPALVHATNFKSEIISRKSLKNCKIPLVGSIISDTYGIDRYQLVSRRERFKLNLYKLLNRITANRIDQFVSVSESIVAPNMKYLKQPRKKFIVIPNGRNTKLFEKTASIKRSTLFPDSPSNAILVLSTSRVIRSKGFDEMLGAFKILIEKYSNLYFYVAGDGYDLEYYKKKSEEMGLINKVFFLGKRDDVPQLLLNADIFWFPSHYEGSPGVVIEAMMAKIPIIASDIPPVLENLENGVNALICTKGVVFSLVEKTEYLIANPTKGKEMAEKAYLLAINKFDIKKLTAIQENVYLELIDQYES